MYITTSVREWSLNELNISISGDSRGKKGNIELVKNCPAGHDEIKASTSKSVSPYIVEPRPYICNLSISQGAFPSKLKVANVLLLCKADDSFLFNHYRPVSLLNVLSKVFERIMYNRVSEFFETLKILVYFQFGFRKWHSSYMALLISSLPNPHNWHPTARPWGWHVECLLWYWSLI